MSTRRLLLAVVSLSVLYFLFQAPADADLLAEEAPGPGQFKRRIVAIGDLHGDFPNALKVMQMTRVVDKNGNWSGNVDILVQTGDIIDRGDDTLKLFAFMEELRVQAQAAGGQVLSLLGNHEVMNSIGDWRYVYPSEIATFGGVAERQKMLSTGWLGRAWAQNYTITARLPLHPSLGPANTDHDPKSPQTALSHSALSFVHGGLSPTFTHLTPYPSSINAIGRSLLRKLQHRVQPPPHPPNPYPGLPSSATLAEHELYDGNGPVWYRGWALEDEKIVCGAVDGVLQKIGARRLIMGHTPTFTNIVSRCNGKIIIIDTGISHAYGGVLSALSITYTLTAKDLSDQSTLSKWTESEVVRAVYEGHDEVIIDDERVVQGDFRAWL